jgi:hypothetical protein
MSLKPSIFEGLLFLRYPLIFQENIGILALVSVAGIAELGAFTNKFLCNI